MGRALGIIRGMGPLATRAIEFSGRKARRG